jgi:hypothetical protein
MHYLRTCIRMVRLGKQFDRIVADALCTLLLCISTYFESLYVCVCGGVGESVYMH